MRQAAGRPGGRGPRRQVFFRRARARVGRAARLLAAPLLLAPLGAAPARAQAPPRRDLRVPMRDGIELATALWLPDTAGRFPTVLIRTPYGVNDALFRRYRLARYVDAGYAVAMQDTRGQGGSGGTFDFYFPEGEDGYDTVEWIARQAWSDGRVAMDGGSYLGTVQWLAAREHPPHLKCILPDAPSGRIFGELPYVGGAFMMEWALPWVAERVDPKAAASADWAAVAAHRPLLSADSVVTGRAIPIYREMLEHRTFDSWWRRIELEDSDFAAIDLPALTVTGWFDGDQAGALHYWRGMRAHSPARDAQYLVIGPWTHPETYLGRTTLEQGEIPLSSNALLDTQALRLAFLGSCLKGKATSFRAPRALVYLIGADRWLALDDYPAPGTRYTRLYLSGEGSANGLAGGGALSWKRPQGERSDTFTYDPHRPVANLPGGTDQRRVEARRDVLVYTGAPLRRRLDVVGPLDVVVYAASDARGTDFTAKLVDVWPDGRAVRVNWAGGVIRARYRHGFDHTEALQPGRVERYRIELYDVGYAFLPGHRIRLEVSSSAFPYVNPNQNTGAPVATDTAWVVAHQRVLHGGAHASYVLLPVLPAAAAAPAADSLPASAPRRQSVPD